MIRSWLFAGLMLLAIPLSAGAHPGAPRVQDARLPEGRSTRVEEIPVAATPVPETRRPVVLQRFDEFTGGPAGVLLTAAALLAALALILVVVYPW